MTEETAVTPSVEVVEQSFTIRVQFVPGGDQPPVFDFTPSDGMSPMDCIAMCNQGITWSLEALEMVQKMAAQAPKPNREQRRAAAKNKSQRIWTPGNA